MTTDINEILELLNRISLSDSPKQLLTDLKITLTGLQVNRIQNAPSINEYVILFDNLNSSDKEQIELCVDILNKLLPLLNGKIVIEQLGEHIFRCFSHPDETVRSLALRQVKKCAEMENGVLVLLSRRQLIIAAASCLGDESLGVVNLATDTTVAISSTSIGVASIFSNEVVSTLEKAMAKSDSARFNVYDAIVKVALLGDEALAIVSNSVFLEKLIAEVTGGDILTQLNALEMITSLTVNTSGLALLQQAGIVSKFQYLLSLVESDPLAAMLLPGLLKFFGNLGHQQPLFMSENYASVLSTILKLASGDVESCDPVSELVALETITYIGYSVEGKYTLMKLKAEMQKCLTYLSEKFRLSPTDYKSRLIEALIPLFNLEVENINDDLLTTMENWFNAFMDSHTIRNLTNIIKQPIPELHLSSMCLLKAIVCMPWGQKKVTEEPGFVEYLMNRATESSKRGKELKWEIIEIIVKSSFSSSIFGSESLDKMSKYYKEGPFYVKADPQLAFEGDGDT